MIAGYDSWKTDYPEAYDFEDAPELPEDASHEELLAAGYELIPATASAYFLAGIIDQDELTAVDLAFVDCELFGVPVPAELLKAA